MPFLLSHRPAAWHKAVPPVQMLFLCQCRTARSCPVSALAFRGPIPCPRGCGLSPQSDCRLHRVCTRRPRVKHINTHQVQGYPCPLRPAPQACPRLHTAGRMLSAWEPCYRSFFLPFPCLPVATAITCATAVSLCTPVGLYPNVRLLKRGRLTCPTPLSWNSFCPPVWPLASALPPPGLPDTSWQPA